MGDTKIVYDEKFGINTLRREICWELGEKFWEKLTENMVLPDIETEGSCQCRNMCAFMHRLEEMADAPTVRKILCKVRHGLHPSQSSWAREEFLDIGNLDVFLKIHHDRELDNFIRMNREKKDFYGQEVTDEVLEFIRNNPAMLAPVRKGNKLVCMAFPCNMNEYLKAKDSTMKRYHACHCPFAKESILSDETVSATLCYCSLGHVMNFVEAFLDRELKGRVVHSVLNGDTTCEYEITIPNDIMFEYVMPKEAKNITENYYRYYRSFALSGIVDLHEGPVDWIMPKEGEAGPSLAFHVNLDENRYREEIHEMTAGIRAGAVPQRWLITPDAEPKNIVEILKENGFQEDLSEDAENPEPGMLLNAADFYPYADAESASVLCREVQTKEDFERWVDVVNTALHGWKMIDADHYYVWVKQENIRIYLAEIDGVPVSTAATIQTGNTASLEFVSTLEAYRRKKAALALSSKALENLFACGVENVTLSGSCEAVALYEKLGFRACFHNVIMLYDV
ncbi:MAG: GNAT family N-acetyltransferase [Lachnospiraceae bacterium]|nr:GNAT family N-acetyltransferase [Lachnospiraceae bacterium]